MVLVVCAVVLCALFFFGFRQSFTAGVPFVLRGFDGLGVVAAFVISTFAAMMFGPFDGLSVILALLIYEGGHWAALRVLGTETPEFRLFPLITGVHRPEFRTDEARVFHALMAPGMTVPPMLLALALALQFDDRVPEIASFCFALTLNLCLLGTVNLLPFRGLAGGRIADAVARVLSPSVLPLSLACAVAGLALLGWSTGLVWAYPVAALGLLGLFLPARPAETRPMAPSVARIAVATWVAIITAEVAGAWMLLIG